MRKTAWRKENRHFLVLHFDLIEVSVDSAFSSSASIDSAASDSEGIDSTDTGMTIEITGEEEEAGVR